MWIKKILRRYGYDIKKHRPLFEMLVKKYDIDTVIDVGANNGQFAERMREMLPQAQIYSFEPLKDCFETLTEKFKHDAHFKSFNTALGEENKKTVIKRSSFAQSSSLLPMSALHKKLYPKSEKITDEEIQIQRLDDVARNLTLSKNILVKIDVQGFEDHVIKGGKTTISQAKLVLVETSFVSLYEGQALFGDILALLRELGFVYYSHGDQHWDESTGEPTYQDSIFIKP